MITRRELVGGTAAVLSLSGLPALAQAAYPEVTVWRDPSCGCCEGWVRHMRGHGFTLKMISSAAELAKAKTQHGIPERLQSCHTASVGGYVLEGHVPAADVKRLLAERPKAKGLAVPGMPLSSPGMDAGKDNFDVILFGQSGGAETVFATH